MESTVFVLDDGEDIPLKELNLTFIHDFEYFLRTEKKCRSNTVWGYMIVLKHIFGTCIRKFLLSCRLYR